MASRTLCSTYRNVIGLAGHGPDIACCRVAGGTVRDTRVVHQCTRAPGCTDSMAATATGAGHRRNGVCQRTCRRAGTRYRGTCCIMTTGRCTIARRCHTSVAVRRQPCTCRVTDRTLLTSDNVICLGGCKAIPRIGVASSTVGHAGMVHQRARAPGIADLMAATACRASHRGDQMRQRTGCRNTRFWNCSIRRTVATSLSTIRSRRDAIGRVIECRR